MKVEGGWKIENVLKSNFPVWKQQDEQKLTCRDLYDPFLDLRVASKAMYTQNRNRMAQKVRMPLRIWLVTSILNMFNDLKLGLIYDLSSWACSCGAFY